VTASKCGSDSSNSLGLSSLSHADASKKMEGDLISDLALGVGTRKKEASQLIPNPL